MARSRKSHEASKEDMKRTRNGREPAYSGKVDGHRYVIYCHMKKDNISHVLVEKFFATYAANYFIDKVIGNDTIEWSKWFDRDTSIITSSGICIRAHLDQIREIYEYDPTEAESEWVDDQLIRKVNSFKYGASEYSSKAYIEENLPMPPEERKQRREKSNKVREAKPQRVKHDTSGMISANDIAKKLGVEGREVRAVLRAMKLEKPEYGWMFDPKTAAEIEVKVKDGLKAKKK